MRTLTEGRSERLRGLFWRDEIPEAMYWLGREGFGAKVDLDVLECFLSRDPELDPSYLDGLVVAGLLRRSGPGSYELTEEGSLRGARLFADDFSEFERAARTACGGCSEGAPASACGCGCCGEEPETADQGRRAPREG